MVLISQKVLYGLCQVLCQALLDVCHNFVTGYASSCTLKLLRCQWRSNCSVPDVHVMRAGDLILGLAEATEALRHSGIAMHSPEPSASQPAGDHFYLTPLTLSLTLSRKHSL